MDRRECTTQEMESEKLRLEIEELRRQQSRSGAFVRNAPLLAVFVALTGLLAGGVQFVNDHRVDRKLRIETKIHDNIRALLAFPSSGASTASALRAVSELNSLSKLSPESRIKITEVLVELILVDCDFLKLEEARLDGLIVRQWPGYVEHLKQNQTQQQLLMYKYFQAFRQLHLQDPEYFETINYDLESGFVVKKYQDEHRYRLFAQLIIGYHAHLEHLNDDQRLSALLQFNEALSNPSLSKTLFGTTVVRLVPE